jgi:hypothetical protein
MVFPGWGIPAMAQRRDLIEVLHNFLKESGAPKVRRCQNCKLLMQHIPVTFELDGEELEVSLPFCPRCTVALAPKKKHIA